MSEAPQHLQTEHLIEVENLSVDFDTRYGVVKAVRKVSFHLDRGETLAILGESGSGKSVSASAIMDLIDMPPGRIRSGIIRYRGEDLLTVSPERRRTINGRSIAMIFQDPLAALNPVYTVGWQIAEIFRIHGEEPGHEREAAIRLLERVGIPEPTRRIDDYPHQFSGGQRQRVMIAMAIALRPDLLIADEPTTALDVTVQAQILKLLKELQGETGMGLLLITHDLGVAWEVADRVAVMQEGRIVETGRVAEVLANPQHPYTRRLVDSVPGRHGFADGAACEGETLLAVRNLCKTYEVTNLFSRQPALSVRALDDVSIELRRGESLGIVGESGSGKSTLARTILGLEEASAGEVLYRGRNVAGLTSEEMFAFRRQIQVVFQDPTASLNPFMTVGQIIAEPWAIHKDVVPRNERPARVLQLLESVGLKAEHAQRHPHQFSGGQRQRIAIARALALNPSIIVCDEAVSALDVSIQAQVIDLLKRLRRDYALSYIFIAHNLPVVRDFCDRVAVMYRGRIVEEGATAALFEAPQHPYTRDLLNASPVIEGVALAPARTEVRDPASNPTITSAAG
jgi:peptide/nickel transport system ATP-binding protein